MSDGPVVSALMPAFNAEGTILEAIQSVRAQSFDDWELIVFDDGSTDRTGGVVKPLLADPRIRYERSERNRGRGAAQNVALKLARGGLIAITDADDVQLPLRFERQVAFLREHPEIDVLGGQLLYFDDRHPPHPRFVYPCSDQEIRSRFARARMGIAHAGCMLRRSVFERAGGYDERFLSSQDFELLYRIRSWCRFAALEEPLVHYRASVAGPTWERYIESEFWGRYAVHLAEAGSTALAPPAFHRRLERRFGLQLIDRARFLRVRFQALLGRVHALH